MMMIDSDFSGILFQIKVNTVKNKEVESKTTAKYFCSS